LGYVFPHSSNLVNTDGSTLVHLPLFPILWRYGAINSCLWTPRGSL